MILRNNIGVKVRIMSINEIQDQIVEEFLPKKAMIEKYKYLTQLAKQMGKLDSEFKIDQNSIKGCQSSLWLVTNLQNGKMTIQGDTDVVITKGILSLILRVYNNQNPIDILEKELYFLEKIGLRQALSPQRANGVGAVIEHIKHQAKLNLK